MKKLLLVTTALVAAAGPAHAGPVAAVAAWVGSTLAGGGLAAFAMNTALSLGLSAIGAALYQPPGQAINVSFDVKMGDDQPLSFIAGDYVTAGKRKYIGSWGKNTRYITEVVEVSALPHPGLEAMWVNDEPGEILWGETGTDGTQHDLGHPLTNFADEDLPGQRFIWIRWLDGTQTAADPMLVGLFGSDPDYPWTSAMIGRGKSYAVVTTRFNEDTLSSYPSYLFKPAPLPCYDLRFDSSNGGSGPQRWTDRATWQPSRNPAVISYNIARGIHYGPEWVYGGKNLPAWRLPPAEWIAAANACDARVTLADGSTEPAYRCGLEISVDTEPARVLEEIGKAANMKFAEVGGRLKPIVDLPGAAVFSFTDGDILITEGQSFRPFYSVSETFNAISATYPEPGEKWTSKDAPIYVDADSLDADGGRYLPTSMSYPAAPHGRQVQRLMRSQMRDFRRMRQHQFSLPPDAYGLEPGVDVVSWTSARNGYINKLFMVERVAKVSGMNVPVTLREIDPGDYDWSSDFERPIIITPPVNPRPFVQAIEGLTVTGAIIRDADSNARRAAILVACNGDEIGVSHIQIEGRVSGRSEISIDTLRRFSAPFAWYLLNVIPGTSYEVRARLLSELTPRSAWSGWITVQAPDVRIDPDDIDVTPPVRPAPVTLTSTPGVLVATWTPSANTVYSDLEVTEDGGNPVTFQTSGGRYEWKPVRSGIAYAVRRRAVDRVGNRSEWSQPATHIVARDTVPPAAPKNLKVVGTFNAFVLEWGRNTEADLAYYELAVGTATNPTAVVAAPLSTNFILGGQPNSARRYFRVRAVDTSENRSGWSAVVEATTLAPALTTITTEDLAGLVDATTFADGVQPIRIHVGPALPASYLVDVIAWNAALYRWDPVAGRYVKDILAPGAVQTAHLDAGAVTAQKMAIGFGANLVTNSNFVLGLTGWNWAGTGGSFADTAISIMATGVAWSGRNYPTLQIRQGTAAPDGQTNLVFRGVADSSGALGWGWPVKAGDWLEFSVQLSTHRCNAEIAIDWRDETGAVIASTPVVSMAPNAGSVDNPDLWNLLWVSGAAPTGAFFGSIRITKYGTLSGTNSFVFVHKPMFALSTNARSQPTAYAPGSFTFIDGQGLITDSVTARVVNSIDLAVNGLAHLNVAYIKEANITGQLTAAILRGGTALLGTIQVNGAALGTTVDRAADPAARINSGPNTQIDPGKIRISGSKTLADWRYGPDETQIDGGYLGVNTVRANTLELGSRNVTVENIAFTYNDPAPDRVAWSSGVIRYPADDGTTFVANIPAGSGPVWVAGATQYIVYTKNTQVLWVTTSPAVAFNPNVLILATYNGGARLNSQYGRTIIDGWGVRADNLLVRNRAQMGEAVVDTLVLAGNAVTVPATVASSVLVTLTDAWADLATIGIARQAAPTLVMATFQVDGAGAGASLANFRLLRDGVQVGSTYPTVTGTRGTQTSGAISVLDSDLGTGATSYKLQAQRMSSGDYTGTPRVVQRTVTVLHVKR